MSLVDIKVQARSLLHQAMAVPCVYTSPGGDVYPTEAQAAAGLVLKTRWHNKIARNGVLTGGSPAGGYESEIIEGIDRLVFQQPMLDALGLVLERTGVVVIPGYGSAWELDSEEPADGPLNRYWVVASAGDDG